MLQHAFTVALVVLLAIGSITVVAAEEPKDAGGKKQITNSIGMKLVLIPAGEFLMGTRKGKVPALELGTTRSLSIACGSHGHFTWACTM